MPLIRQSRCAKPCCAPAATLRVYTDNETSDETAPVAAEINPIEGMAALRSTQTTFAQIIASMKGKIDSLLAQPPPLTSEEARRSFERWKN